MNNNNYYSGNSFKEAIKTFSNTPIGNMTNIESTYNEPKTDNKKSIFFWIFIIILLAFLGFNIFKYLAQGTDIITSLLSPIAYIITMISGDTAKTTLQHTSHGTQTIASESSNFIQLLVQQITNLFNNSVKFIANTSTSGIDYLQSTIKQDKLTASTEQEKTKTNEDDDEDEDEDGILKNERTIENRIQDVPKYVKQSIVDKEDKLPLPNSSDSQHHGFCYVGKQNNLRHCAKVSSKSTCMSGDIFPTMDLCINPKLR